MLSTYRMAAQKLNCLSGVWTVSQIRQISALYMTGDKAKENYPVLQPYMDFEDTFRKKESLEHSIKLRELTMDLNTIWKKYEKYMECSSKLKHLEAQRESVANQMKDLSNAGKTNDALIDELKEQGRLLRNEFKSLKEASYPIEEEFIQDFLNIPNELHKNCPTQDEKLLYRSGEKPLQPAASHLTREDLIHFIDNKRYYMMQEAAYFDVFSMQNMVNYIVMEGDYLQMANPDFVRRVLLEAAATPEEQYHQVVEKNLQNPINCAFLAGGGAFESFLGAVAKLCIYPTHLPLQCVACGRSYHRTESDADIKKLGEVEANLFTATQTNAVPTFVACETASEADDHMEYILNLAVNFYKQIPGLHFRVVNVPAKLLTPSECLRANIEIYSPAQQRYIVVGHVSNYSDFVSKRILFAMRRDNDYHFPHIVGGPVLYTSRLIGLMIEYGIPLDHKKLLGHLEPDRSIAAESPTAIEEFKNTFK